MGKIVVLAGNVGAGKSTFTKALSEELGYKSHFESVSDNPFLESFYKDQKRWSYHLQTYFLIHRFTALKNAENSGENYIFDRSIYEDAEIFARNLFESGNMPELEFRPYIEMFYELIGYLRKPDLLIYIDTDVDTILSRIRRRGRQMELEVPMNYWEKLDRLYDNWISDYSHSPVYTIDARTIDIKKKPEQITNILNDLKKILK